MRAGANDTQPPFSMKTYFAPCSGAVLRWFGFRALFLTLPTLPLAVANSAAAAMREVLVYAYVTPAGQTRTTQMSAAKPRCLVVSAGARELGPQRAGEHQANFATVDYLVRRAAVAAGYE